MNMKSVGEIKILRDTLINDENVDNFFYSIIELSDKLSSLLTSIDRKINGLKYLSRLRAKRDFEKIVGSNLLELEQDISQMSQLWRKIYRCINMCSYKELECSLKTYNYRRDYLYDKIISFKDYKDRISQFKYFDVSSKNFIEETVSEFILVLEELHAIIDSLYSQIVI